MAEEQLSITYTGPALQGGRMSVHELAPALLAFAGAVQQAHRVLEPAAPEPRLDIRATAEGSFLIDLLLVDGASNILTRARDMLVGPWSEAGLNATQYVAYLGGALQGLLALRGLRIRRSTPGDDGQVRMELSDGSTITLPAASLQLMQDVEFRRDTRRVMAPLETEGVDAVTVESTSTRLKVRVRREQLDAFQVPDVPEQLVSDSTRTVALRPVSVTFRENNKWRVSDGDQTFFATVEDQSFLDRVAASEERFGSGDLLLVELRTRQYATETGLRPEHAVLKVHEHRPGARQIPLPLESQDGQGAGAGDVGLSRG